MKRDLKKVLSAIARHKDRDRVISRQLHDMVRGLDSDASSKETFGQWVSTLMVHIDNDKFVEYATGLLNYTFYFMNQSQAAQEAGYVHPRSTSAPPPFAQCFNSVPGQSSPLNLTTPPKHCRSSTQGPSESTEGTSHSSPKPSQQQQAEHRPAPVLGDGAGDRNAAATSSFGAGMLDASNQSAYDESTGFGPGFRMRPGFTGSANVAAPSGNVSYDASGRVFTDLQTPPRCSAYHVAPGTWNTPGPSAPHADPVPLPSGSLNASLMTLALQIKSAQSCLSQYQKQAKGNKSGNDPVDKSDDDITDV